MRLFEDARYLELNKKKVLLFTFVTVLSLLCCLGFVVIPFTGWQEAKRRIKHQGELSDLRSKIYSLSAIAGFGIGEVQYFNGVDVYKTETNLYVFRPQLLQNEKAIPDLENFLVNSSYDPTNGTYSEGVTILTLILPLPPK